MQNIRSIIRKTLQEEYATDGAKPVYPTNDKGKFPYGGDSHRMIPQEIDPIASYVWDWKQLADNHEVYEFPTTEFNLGLTIERQRNPEMNILEVAKKVVEQLQGDAQFYSSIRERNLYGIAGA